MCMAIIMVSCKKKFHHKIDATIVTSSCSNCASADAVSGTYRGLASGQYVPNNSDSAIYTIEHIFLNLGDNNDSTQSYFRITRHFDSSPTVYSDTLKMYYSNNGFSISSSNGGYHTDINLSNDSLHFHDWAYFWQTGGSFEYVNFHGKKL